MDKEELGFLIEYIVGGAISIQEAESILEWRPGVLENIIGEVMAFKNVNDRKNTVLIKKDSKVNVMKISQLEPSTLLKKVEEFQLAGGEKLNLEEPSVGTKLLREKLHQEECQETMDALALADDVGILDGLCDIEVVNLGGANVTGNKEHVRSSYALIVGLPSIKIPINMVMQNLKQLKWDQHGLISYFVWSAAISLGYSKQDFLEAFLRVHESNMSKFCRTIEEAQATVSDYHKKGVETYYIKNDGKYVIKRKSDDKTLKSINYKPVDLTDIVKRVYGE